VKMTEIPEPPRMVDSKDSAAAPNRGTVPAYRAGLPATMSGIEEEIRALKLERANKNRGANAMMVLGMCSGAAAFVLPAVSFTSQLAGPETLVNAVSNFQATLIGCVAVGVVLGLVSASLRSRVRFIDSRLRALDSEQQRLAANQAKGEPSL
jgi:hypothetical protein